MASARYATLCSPDALLHGSDLLHWQTLRCLSGLGLLHPEIFIVSRPALRRPCGVFLCGGSPELRRQPTCSSASPSFCLSLPWVIKGTPHLRHPPTCSSAPPSLCQPSLCHQRNASSSSRARDKETEETLTSLILGGLVRGVDDMKKVCTPGALHHPVSCLLRLLFSSSTAEP